MFMHHKTVFQVGALLAGLLLAACSSSGSTSIKGFGVSGGEEVGFFGPEGGPFDPARHSITLSNTSSETIEWAASVSEPWLAITENGGALPPDGTVDTDISVELAEAGSLAPGSYHATVVFTDLTPGGQAIEVTAALVVTSPVIGGGLFITANDLQRARQRAQSVDEPFASSYQNHRNRALGDLNATADPFHMDDMSTIIFGWCGEDTNNIDDSLRDAVDKFDIESDWMRTLALEYALTGDTQFAAKAVEIMLAWAAQHTPVNVYDFHPDFVDATIDGMTSGYCSDRPWNFALCTIWQTYGLTNASDAYVLLTRNGYSLSPAEDTAIRDWLVEVTEAVNSGFHAWTRWADAHPTSGSYERYRSDNHLSWSLVGILAAAVALDDAELKSYVLEGGAWFDSHAGLYANPSHIYDVLDRAIESGTGVDNEGRIYEELILRNPPIGYALFHLHAMELVARIAGTHDLGDVWNYLGSDGGGIMLAFDRYVAFLLGERESPRPDQEGDLTAFSSLYEMAYAVWPDGRYADAINTNDRLSYRRQAVGPTVLLLGEVLP